MTATKSKTERIALVQARYQSKSDPRKVTYVVHSDDKEKRYYVYLFAGKVCSCHEQATGEPCRGYGQWGHCYHASTVQKAEDERSEAELASTIKKLAEAGERIVTRIQERSVMAADKMAAPLGRQGFSLMR